ncbi:MAG TPA: DUF2905 domain-containing protein [Anaerolineae bacterium]
MEDIGRMLLAVGVLLVLIGGAVMLISRVPGIVRLPGDIVIQRDGFSCFFPIVTSILLSIVLTIVLNLVLYVIRR